MSARERNGQRAAESLERPLGEGRSQDERLGEDDRHEARSVGEVAAGVERQVYERRGREQHERHEADRLERLAPRQRRPRASPAALGRAAPLHSTPASLGGSPVSPPARTPAPPRRRHGGRSPATRSLPARGRCARAARARSGEKTKSSTSRPSRPSACARTPAKEGSTSAPCELGHVARRGANERRAERGIAQLRHAGAPEAGEHPPGARPGEGVEHVSAPHRPSR